MDYRLLVVILLFERYYKINCLNVVKLLYSLSQ